MYNIVSVTSLYDRQKMEADGKRGWGENDVLEHDVVLHYRKYCKISNISRTKYQNLNDSRLILQLSLPNPLKPDVKSWMEM